MDGVEDEDMRGRQRRAAGRWLREQMERRRVTAAELADALGVGQPQISNYVNGKGDIGRDAYEVDYRLQVIARVLALPVEEVRRQFGLWTPDGEEQRTMTIDEFLRQDPHLDDLSRQHYRQQYDHLVHATEARRRAAAYIPEGSGWSDDGEVNDALAAWQAEHGRWPSSAEEVSAALRAWRDRH